MQDDNAHSVLIMTDLFKDNQDRHIGNSQQEDDMLQFTREQVLTTQLIGVVNEPRINNDIILISSDLFKDDQENFILLNWQRT